MAGENTANSPAHSFSAAEVTTEIKSNSLGSSGNPVRTRVGLLSRSQSFCAINGNRLAKRFQILRSFRPTEGGVSSFCLPVINRQDNNQDGRTRQRLMQGINGTPNVNQGLTPPYGTQLGDRGKGAVFSRHIPRDDTTISVDNTGNENQGSKSDTTVLVGCGKAAILDYKSPITRNEDIRNLDCVKLDVGDNDQNPCGKFEDGTISVHSNRAGGTGCDNQCFEPAVYDSEVGDLGEVAIPDTQCSCRKNECIRITVDKILTCIRGSSPVGISENEIPSADSFEFRRILASTCAGAIVSLIMRPKDENSQSLPDTVCEALVASAAAVGFCIVLGLMYLTTHGKSNNLLFSSRRSEVLTQKLETVACLATAFGFIGGLVLLLPNNMFRLIMMGLTMAICFITIIIKLLRK